MCTVMYKFEVLNKGASGTCRLATDFRGVGESRMGMGLGGGKFRAIVNLRIASNGAEMSHTKTTNNTCSYACSHS